MSTTKCPVAVLILSCVYIAVGATGSVVHFHFHELMALQYDSLWIEPTELLAVISGAFMIRGRNWARWLALVWMAFHVAISFPVFRQFVTHSIIFGLIAWALFRPDARRYFTPLKSDYE
jgi:hypothetical protein